MTIERNARTEVISGSGGDTVDLSGSGGGTLTAPILLGPTMPSVPTPPIITPTVKAALGPLGVGMAAFPPGSMAMVTDDATGPTSFVLAYVDGGPTWVRCDSSTPIS